MLPGFRQKLFGHRIFLNPDFAVGFVMRSSNTIQKRLSGYFLSEGIVIYFELKK
jgi:hypothetical protein